MLMFVCLTVSELRFKDVVILFFMISVLYLCICKPIKFDIKKKQGWHPQKQSYEAVGQTNINTIRVTLLN